MNNEGIFARRERIDSEIREAKKDLIREKRTNRELRKLQSGGRVTPFLRREADKSQVVAAAVNLATAGNPLALGQAMIQYQAAINESKRDPLKTENNPRPESPKEGDALPAGENMGDLLYWDGEAWVILPPPSGIGTKVLASTGGVPIWLATEECD